MAKTEIIQVLRIIETAKLEIMETRGKAGAETDSALEELGMSLDQIEHDLIMEDLKSRADKLSQSATELTSIIGKANQEIDDIKKIAATIERVTKAIRIVTSIVVKASAIV